MTSTTFSDDPRPSVRELQERLATELSTGSRTLFTLLLALDLGVAAAVGSLWFTEPGLPARTRIAFGAIFLLAIAWAGIFAWTLAQRKVFLARHRLVTGRLSLVCSAAFVAGALTVAVTVPPLRQTALLAAGSGCLFVVAAAALWRRAVRRHRQLLDRAVRLERDLAALTGPG